MATIIELVPKEYGFVAIVLVIYCLLNLYMAAQVAIVRKRYKVPYPTLYASESQNKYAKLFNCIQRGHQNSLETMAVFFMLMILGGLKHPSICGVLGVLYIIAGYFYFKGYATGDPNNRHKSRKQRTKQIYGKRLELTEGVVGRDTEMGYLRLVRETDGKRLGLCENLGVHIQESLHGTCQGNVNSDCDGPNGLCEDSSRVEKSVPQFALLTTYEGGHHASGSCWIIKLTTSALKIMVLQRG
ncbi:hypothetical protein HN51_024586 [Arachis hypogaea]